MKNISYLLLIIMLSSCSTMKKAKRYGGIYGGIIGILAGSVIGQSLSPNEESDKFNSTIGAASGAAIGYYYGRKMGDDYWKEDPNNMKMKNIMKHRTRQKDQPMFNNDLSLNVQGIGNSLSPKTKYEIPTSKNVPSYMKDKVYKQVIIEHDIKDQVINTNDGRTLHIDGKAIEHRFIMEANNVK